MTARFVPSKFRATPLLAAISIRRDAHAPGAQNRKGRTSPGGPPKLDAQVMAAAQATFVTKESLAGMRYDAVGSTATDASLIARVESYGFDCTAGGVGSTWIDVGTSGAAFDVADGTRSQIIDLLLATNLMSRNGLLYDDDDEGEDGHGELDEWELLLRTLANDVYSRINELGQRVESRMLAGVLI